MSVPVKNNLSVERKFSPPVEGTTCERFDVILFGSAWHEVSASR